MNSEQQPTHEADFLDCGINADELSAAELASIASIARAPYARLKLLLGLSALTEALTDAIERRAELTDDHTQAAGLASAIALTLLADEVADTPSETAEAPECQ